MSHSDHRGACGPASDQDPTVVIFSFPKALVDQEVGAGVLTRFYTDLRDALTGNGWEMWARGVYAHSDMTVEEACAFLEPFFSQPFVRRYAYRFALYRCQEGWNVKNLPAPTE